jgi:hypothetical protein
VRIRRSTATLVRGTEAVDMIPLYQDATTGTNATRSGLSACSSVDLRQWASFDVQFGSGLCKVRVGGEWSTSRERCTLTSRSWMWSVREYGRSPFPPCKSVGLNFGHGDWSTVEVFSEYRSCARVSGDTEYGRRSADVHVRNQWGKKQLHRRGVAPRVGDPLCVMRNRARES